MKTIIFIFYFFSSSYLFIPTPSLQGAQTQVTPCCKCKEQPCNQAYCPCKKKQKVCTHCTHGKKCSNQKPNLDWIKDQKKKQSNKSCCECRVNRCLKGYCPCRKGRKICTNCSHPQCQNQPENLVAVSDISISPSKKRKRLNNERPSKYLVLARTPCEVPRPKKNFFSWSLYCKPERGLLPDDPKKLDDFISWASQQNEINTLNSHLPTNIHPEN